VNDPGEIVHATLRGAISAMAMTGMSDTRRRPRE
jgi:hypothetical protein